MGLNTGITTKIKDLLQKNPQGLSITEIVDAIRINRNTAGRYLENLLVSGQVEMRRFGMAKIYTLSERVPLSAVLSITAELVLQLDSGLRILFANTPFLALIGSDKKALVGKHIQYTPVAAVLAEPVPEFITNIREGLTGKEWSGEIALTAQDLIFFCRIAPTVFDNGQKGVTVILEDVTIRRKAEMALQESEARLRSIIRVAPVGIGVVSGRILLEVNDRMCEMTGYAAGELIGRSARMLYPTAEAFDYVGEEKYAMIRQSGSGTVQTQWQKKDGRVIDILLSSTPLDPGNLSSGVTFTALDISERIHAEKALRESEQRYRTLAEASSDLIFVIGADDRVEYVNTFAAAMFNRPPDEIVGSPRERLFPPDVAGNQKKQLERVFAGGTPLRSEGPLTFNGRIRWFDHVLIPLKDPDDRVRSVLGISRDITQRKRAENELLNSERRYRRLANQECDAGGDP